MRRKNSCKRHVWTRLHPGNVVIMCRVCWLTSHLLFGQTLERGRVVERPTILRRSYQSRYHAIGAR